MHLLPPIMAANSSKDSPSLTKLKPFAETQNTFGQEKIWLYGMRGIGLFFSMNEKKMGYLNQPLEINSRGLQQIINSSMP